MYALLNIQQFLFPNFVLFSIPSQLLVIIIIKSIVTIVIIVVVVVVTILIIKFVESTGNIVV